MHSLILFFNSNFFIGLVTLVVGFFAIILYIKQKIDKKADAASLILQEIRFAEQKIRSFRSLPSYKLHDKLLPTNSWNDNIHLFINDLGEVQIDLVSNFYSIAGYLDILIQKISDQKTAPIPPMPLSPNPAPMPNVPLIPGFPQPQMISSQIQMTVNPVIEQILIQESGTIEFLYNTPVGEKLKLISKRKWYNI